MKNKGCIILTLLTVTLTPPLCAASTFSYNDLNQLTTSDSNDNTSTRYDYDANGNIIAVRTITPTDTDGDGLPDAWEQQYFNDLSHEPFEDADNDGYSNLEEYEAGSATRQMPRPCLLTAPPPSRMTSPASRMQPTMSLSPSSAAMSASSPEPTWNPS